MQKSFLFLLLLLLTACGGKKDNTASTNTPGTPIETLGQELPTTGQSFDINDFKILKGNDLPREIDLDVDFSQCSLQELVLLRNYVYAIHNCYFTEVEIESFFQVNTSWYYPLVYELCEEKDTVLDYDTTPLSDEERDFVARVDSRIAELMAAGTQPGTGLADPAVVKTLWQFTGVDSLLIDRLHRYNFAIAPTDCEQLFNIYEENDYRQLGSFITTDVMLQLFHMYFVYAQKSLEKNSLTQQIVTMSGLLFDEARHDGDTDDAAFARAFFAVPLALNHGDTLPEHLGHMRNICAQELANINAQQMAPSPLMNTPMFPYDQFRPRGYYDRDDWAKRYFRLMQWLQLAGFNYEDELMLHRAVYIATLLNRNAAALEAYRQVDGAIRFLMGESDNVSVLDLAEALRKADCTQADDSSLAVARDCIASLSQTRNRIRSKLDNPADRVVNFMPSRYLPDNEVLCRMADETPNSDKAFPRGLDVMAAFGSSTAKNLLSCFYNDDEAWDNWEKELSAQSDRLKRFTADEADKTVYNKWMSTLVKLQNGDKSRYPVFMRTDAWALKDANTALASWAELKHDALLYAEQPLLAECGGGGCLPMPYPKGYVEPNLEFWQAMEELCTLTRTRLKDCGMPDELDDKLTQIQGLVTLLRQCVEKELRGELLGEETYYRLSYFGSSIEWLTLSLIYPDVLLADWRDVQGADRSIACVADVFTRQITDCRRCGVLHVGTGLADAIYVIVRIGDYYYLTRGAVLGYREFVTPLDNRLTDAEWQRRLETQPRFAAPEWMQPLMLDRQPQVDGRYFYSSGC